MSTGPEAQSPRIGGDQLTTGPPPDPVYELLEELDGPVRDPEARRVGAWLPITLLVVTVVAAAIAGVNVGQARLATVTGDLVIAPRGSEAPRSLVHRPTGSTVTVSSASGVVATVTTGDLGRYSVQVPAGSYTVSASCPGGGTAVAVEEFPAPADEVRFGSPLPSVIPVRADRRTSVGLYCPVLGPLTTVPVDVLGKTWTIAPVLAATSRPCSSPPAPDPIAPGTQIVCSADGRVAYRLGRGMNGHIVQSTAIDYRAASVSATPQIDVDLRLSGSARAAFAEMTTAASRQAWPLGRIAVVLQGRVVCASQVLEPLSSGQFELAGGFTWAQAREIAAGGDLHPPAAAVSPAVPGFSGPDKTGPLRPALPTLSSAQSGT